MEDLYAQDVAKVARIDVVPTILDTVCRLTGMGFAAIARVSQDRWIACSVRDEIDFGLVPGGELKLETTICHEIEQSGMPVIISDVAADPLYRDHHTPALYGFRSYISMPIILPDGSFFGTLCAIDPKPRDLDRSEIRHVFKMFAELIGFHLNSGDRMREAQSDLAIEREIGEVREQFIAVLGHDLRNPLASVEAGINLLERSPDPARRSYIISQMQGSIGRMVSLIDNILDFARGRLGGGLAMQRAPAHIAPLIAQVVGEFASAAGEHQIVSRCSVDLVVDCDAQRISQLLSNLIGNAVTHGTPGSPIEVICTASATTLSISVANGGEPIPLAAQGQLFQPFNRGQTGINREGLGLGLYIASQIAAAHDGELTVESSADQTRFTFTMPISGPISGPSTST